MSLRVLMTTHTVLDLKFKSSGGSDSEIFLADQRRALIVLGTEGGLTARGFCRRVVPVSCFTFHT